MGLYNRYDVNGKKWGLLLKFLLLFKSSELEVINSVSVKDSYQMLEINTK
jgi:hypothetical protein